MHKAEEWVWFGGRPSIDLVNTRWDRKGNGMERLTSADALADWLRMAKVVDAVVPVRVSSALLDDARLLREAISDLIDASIGSAKPARASVALVNDWVAEHPATPRLDTARWALTARPGSDPATDAVTGVVLDAIDLLSSPARARIKVCDGSTCGFRFYDRSPTGHRQWCSMKLCGNREKARIHRERVAMTGR